MDTLANILILDDEVRSLETLKRTLQDDFNVKTANDIKTAREILQQEWIQIILCDQRMPEMTGVEFLKQVREEWPDVIRMIISGYTDSEDIIDAINDAGIYQYITKPWHPSSLLLNLKNASEMYLLQKQNEGLSIELKMDNLQLQKRVQDKSSELRKNYHYDDGIIRSKESSMNQVCDKIKSIAPYDVSVLISGESGTGKELVARSLHYNSERWDQTFVVENCAALPDELLESELFGYKKGAFTGAVEDRVGLFERANKGTIFLDEIGEVSAAFQAKLLRVLQEGEIRPLGSSRTRSIDVRVLAATNKNLQKEVQQGRFREDLFYRLTTVNIHLPSLRSRPTDIPILAKSILTSAIEKLGKEVSGFSSEALQCMKTYQWPGNVRELQNEVLQMLVMSQGKVLGADLLNTKVLHAVDKEQQQEMELMTSFDGTLKQRIESLEAKIIKQTLIQSVWNKSKVAKELGLSRVGLSNKIQRYHLEKKKV